MKNLKMWQKLALMGVVFVLPFGGVVFKMTSSVNALGVDFAKQEIRNSSYTPALALLRNLQQHRDMTAAQQVFGDTSLQAPLDAKAADLLANIKAFDKAQSTAWTAPCTWVKRGRRSVRRAVTCSSRIGNCPMPRSSTGIPR